MRSVLAPIALLLALACESEIPRPKPEQPPPPAIATATAWATTSAKPSKPLWKRLAGTWVYPNPIPGFELTNHEGKRFSLRDFRHDYVFVGFIFTTCSVPTACPLTTQKMHELGKLWNEQAKQGKTNDRKLALLSFTIDPDNDTPAALKSYSDLVRRDFARWIFATGPEELMETVLPGMFGVVTSKPIDAGKKAELAHTVRAALLRPGLRIAGQWRNNSFKPADVVELVLE